MLQRVMVAFAALVVLVAVLQYRWILQVSNAERDRQRENLNLAVARFAQEFDGEIARAFFSLQVGRPDAGGEAPESAERIAGWLSSTPYRRIVRSFYRSRGGEDGLAELHRFTPGGERFEAIAWPAHLAELRARLEQRASSSGGAPSDVSGAIDEDIPAVIGLRLGVVAETEAPAIAGWSIAELDLEYIRKELFPELARKHFGGDYDVRVVSRTDPARVVYGGPATVAVDAEAGLLGLRPEPLPLSAAREMTGAAAPGPLDASRWKLVVRHKAGSLDAAAARTRSRDLAVSGLLLVLLSASMALLVVSTRRAQRLAHQQMEFVAGVSHELRTPLTVISSAADNLADGVVAGEPQVKRYGSVIRQETRRLADMVEQLLRFSGLQSGHAHYKLQPVDPEAAIDKALAACARELSDSGMQVQKDVQTALPAVEADPAALIHCLGNLIVNALKHAREGKWIGVSARLAEVGEPAVEFLVEDRGPGIDATDLPHIWEPFYRGREAVSSQVKGAGLGLSLVKRMTEAQGGTVTLVSKPGEGTIFTLRLPAARVRA